MKQLNNNIEDQELKTVISSVRRDLPNKCRGKDGPGSAEINGLPSYQRMCAPGH